MSALVSKIRHSFSDLWLEIELFSSKFKKKKNAINPPVAKSEGEAKEAKEEKTASEAGTGTVVEKEKVKPLEKMPLSLKLLRLSHKERLYLYDQMATLLASGVTLIDSISIVQAQTKKKSLKKLYGEMIHHINGGMSLAETMFLFPHIFPSMHAALIEAGEKSGNLKVVLAQMVEELESQQDFMRKVKGAMFYPVILIVLALAMVSGMMIFVIPKVAELYKQSNTQLPALTQTVINMSEFVKANYPVILASVFGGLFVLWLLIKKTKIGKLIWEKFVSIIPVFGRISKEKNLTAFSSNLGMLLQSGVLISDAFEITEKTMDNLHYKRALAEIRHGIVLGKNVSELMGLQDIKTQKFKENKLFPLQVAQMIQIGEVTGTIAEMLMKVRKNYHKSINYTLKNISTMIEPLMIFIVALLVGSILLAVMLPFFYIGTTIS